MKNPQSETSGRDMYMGHFAFHNFLAVFHDFHLVTKTEFSAVSQATHTLPFPMEGGAKGYLSITVYVDSEYQETRKERASIEVDCGGVFRIPERLLDTQESRGGDVHNESGKRE